MEFAINQTWDGQDVNHPPVVIRLDSHSHDELVMNVRAPFFDDPPNPGGAKGQPFYGLWDYEVVELFLSNEDDQYVEIEVSPWGQHIVLLLDGARNCIRHSLPLEFGAEIDGDDWRGEAIIPLNYLPRNVCKMNAYAIHGTEPDRVYEALHPVPRGRFREPDFHRLEFFSSIDLTSLAPSSRSSDWSDLWRETLNHPVA